MEEIKTTILLLVSIIGLAFAAQKFLFGLFSQAIKRYELYTQIRELCGSNANNNLAQIRVAINTITTRKLTPKEIEWFVYTPSAFRHLKRYGQNARYVDINFETNKFCYAPRIATWKGHLKERIMLFSAYMFCGVAGVVLILNNMSALNTFVFEPSLGIYIIGAALVLMALVFLYMFQLLQSSIDMVKSKLPE